jgi:hypothetical protein
MQRHRKSKLGFDANAINLRLGPVPFDNAGVANPSFQVCVEDGSVLLRCVDDNPVRAAVAAASVLSASGVSLRAMIHLRGRSESILIHGSVGLLRRIGESLAANDNEPPRRELAMVG